MDFEEGDFDAVDPMSVASFMFFFLPPRNIASPLQTARSVRFLSLENEMVYEQLGRRYGANHTCSVMVSRPADIEIPAPGPPGTSTGSSDASVPCR